MAIIKKKTAAAKQAHLLTRREIEFIQAAIYELPIADVTRKWMPIRESVLIKLDREAASLPERKPRKARDATTDAGTEA